MLDWLLGPIDPARAHDVGWHLSMHARCMVGAWGVLVPLGVFAARFLKVLPWQKWPEELDNHLWWNAHRGAQYSALIIMAVGIWMIRSAEAPAGSLTETDWIHRILGWWAVASGCIQYLSGWLRGSKGGPTDKAIRGDHYDMTPRRLLFERLHKLNGYSALCIAVAAILTGLWQANAPVWMWIGIIGWWAMLVSAAVVLSSRLPKTNTYQAIWGPDREHPGNNG